MKILLVEDDESLIAVLTRSLSAHHYVVDVVKDGETGWDYGSTFEYDLMVLDIMLPKLDGIRLCQRFRSEGFTTPILLLTSQDTSTAKVNGLDAGADDYVVKPFDRSELIARIRALLRRGSANPLPLLALGNLLLNPSTCEVAYNDQPLTLTTKEYYLLELLLRDNRRVFSTDEILDRLWSSDEFPAQATVRSHIRRLRHKLVAAGAPSDLISTIHGRGYYLKLPVQEATSQSTLTSDAFDETLDNSHINQDLQYLAFLKETWLTTKPKCLTQLTLLSEAVIALPTDSSNPQHSQQGQHIAHKLAGTLGIFGLRQGMQLARQLEHLLGSNPSVQSKQALLMANLVRDLEREIENTESILISNLPARHSPLLLILDPDSTFSESLVRVAESRGIRTAIAPTLDKAIIWLTSQSLPDVVLLRLSSPQSWQWLETLAQSYPNLPILVIGDGNELSDRLEIVRRGGKLLIEQSATPEQIIDCATQLFTAADLGSKVMIVDDDQNWLQTIPKLLQPWGFKVTTLANPQDFWTVLQSVNPDALLLDVKMPQINGLELCQVLRSDPRWQRLPVLFLTVLADSQTQNQAFTVGADDYLCKPVVGMDLANRIIKRLQRMRSQKI